MRHLAERRERGRRLRHLIRRGHDAQRDAVEIRVFNRRVLLRLAHRDERILRRAHFDQASREPRLDLARRAVRDDLAVEDHHEAIALLRFVHVVRGDEHGHAAIGGQLVNQVPEHAPSARIDAAGGLVEEQQLRLVQQRRRERDALAQSRRQSAGQHAQRLLELQPRGEFRDPLFERVVRQPVHRAEEAQVLDDGEVGVERELLAHVAEPVLPLLGLLRRIESAEAGDLAARRLQQSRQHADRRRLARSVRAEESEDLAARNVEADVVHRDETAEPARQIAHAHERAAVLAVAVAAVLAPAEAGFES